MEDIVTTGEQFSFSFTLEQGADKVHYLAVMTNKAISNSAKTKLLCRTWIADGWNPRADQTFLMMKNFLLEPLFCFQQQVHISFCIMK